MNTLLRTLLSSPLRSNHIFSLFGRRQERSLMKLIVDEQTDKVIGASMCGPDAAEIMQASFPIFIASTVPCKDFEACELIRL